MSGAAIMVIGKAVLTFGCLLGFPLWQYLATRRDLRRLRARREREE